MAEQAEGTWDDLIAASKERPNRSSVERIEFAPELHESHSSSARLGFMLLVPSEEQTCFPFAFFARCEPVEQVRHP